MKDRFCRPWFGDSARRRAAALLAALSGAAALLSQAPAEPQQPPIFRRAVNFVMVDAYPSAQGKPVLDLAQDEFEILEDGVPQKVAVFERKTFREPVPEPLRAEPRTVAESNRMAADPRSRVFVLYLDTYHLPDLFQGVNHYPARDAVRTWMRSLLGEDDIVGFLTPELDAATMTFTRRTSAIDEFLRERWMREIRVDDYDPTERMYQMCYTRNEEQWVLEAMIARKRERQVLRTLHELVGRLGDLREDRKAVLLVGGGWWVYGPDQKLAAPLPLRPLPGSGRIGVDPTGRLGVGRRDDQLQGAFQECEKDRLMLANVDHQREFQSLMGRANRANVSIYPIDPRGLAAPARIEDQDRLKHLRETMRDLASSTDGFTVIDTNDFDRGMKRIVDDMSSYYLLGYYSTNAKLDGRFRKVTVRVKRPGVSVRARNGYLAPTEAELAPPPPAPAAAAPAGPPDQRPDGAALALAELDRLRQRREVFVEASWAWTGLDARREALVTLVAELDGAAARSPEWAGGGSVQVTLHDADGRQVGPAATAVLSALARTARMTVPEAPLRSGPYTVRATAKSAGRTAADQIRLVVPAAAGLLGRPLIFRRGPFTGPAYALTADLRVRKAERLRVDVPTGALLESMSATLLDRNARPLAVPVVLGERAEGGMRYVTGEITLAPLAFGDYLVEMTVRTAGTPESVYVAFRVVP